MSQEQVAAVLHPEAVNPGEYSTPEFENAEAFISELTADSVGADELIAVADTLGNMAEGIANANEGESITSATASALGIAVEHLCRTVGVEHKHRFVLENYTGIASNKQATKVALEGFTDAVKIIVSKLVKIIRRIMDYLYDTMQELFHGADNLVAAARDVQNRAQKIAHKAPQKDISNAKLVGFFTKDGKVYAGKDIAGVYDDYAKLTTASFSTGFIREVGLRVQETVEEAKRGESKESTMVKTDKLVRSLVDKSFHNFKTGKAEGNFELREMELPFGSRVLTLLVSKYGEHLTGLNLNIGLSKTKASSVVERKLEVLTFEQIIDVAKALENQMLFGLFKNYKDAKGDLEKIKRAVEKGCDQITEMQQSDKGDGQAVLFSANFLKDLSSALVKTLAITHAYDILVSKHLLEYCNQSIKQHA